MRGLNTELEPGKLSKGQFPEFTRVTLRSGAIVPTAPDGTHGTPTWPETQLGASIVSDELVMGGTSGFRAYVAQAGGVVQLRSPAGSVEPIAIEAPTDAPGFVSWTLTLNEADGFPPGAEVTVAGAWTIGSAYHTSLGSTITVTQNAYTAGYQTGSGAAPALGDLVSNGTGTATLYQTKTSSGAWTAGDAAGRLTYSGSLGLGTADTLTFTRDGTSIATAIAGNEGTLEFGRLSLSQPGTPPAGAEGWAAYQLGDSGFYYRAGTAATGAPILVSAGAEQAANLYDGPLDANSLPETLVVPGTCQTLTLHKGCLFLGEGAMLRWSEGALEGHEVRWYREGYTIQALGEIWALVSRGEILEVWTAGGIQYVVGSPPYFEIRDTQVSEGPVSRFSIVGTDRGTLYHGADGLRLFAGGVSRLLSDGWNGPWFAAIESPADTVAGASKGAYYLVDATGRCLVWDWEGEEWRERTFSAQPAGFRWNTADNYLVAKIGSSYASVEASTGPVPWAVRFPTEGAARFAPLPGVMWIDKVGDVLLELYADGNLIHSLPLPGSAPLGRLRLPRRRAYRWFVRLSGFGAAATTQVRGYELR